MGVQVNSYFKSKYTGAQIENMLDAFGNTAAAYETSTAYSVGDLVLYNNALYVCTGATTGAFDPSKWQQTTLAELVENLGATYSDPNSDGNVVVGVDSTTGDEILRSITFPTLTKKYYLPFAQYIRERLQNDPSTASFGIEIPDAEEAPMHSTVIKGKTVAVNQLVQNGNFADGTNNWALSNGSGTVSSNVLTFTPSATIATVLQSQNILGHTYYARAAIKLSNSSNASSVKLDVRFSDAAKMIAYAQATTNWQVLEGIQSGGANSVGYIRLIDQRTSDWGTIQVKEVNLVDLTVVFSAAELITIGSSVATFKSSWLTKRGTPLPQYIPHDTGSLANVNGEYKMRGRNLWDEVWENGILYANGTEGSDASSIRSKNFDRCVPNEQYYVKTPSNTLICFYDANKNFISRENATNTAVTAPSEAVYFRLSCPSYGATYQYNICINESDADFNGQYEKAYNGGEIDCSAAPLNGFDDTVCDEKDYATGERITRFPIVDLGTLNWSYIGSGATARFDTNIADMLIPSNRYTAVKALCGLYVAKPWDYVGTDDTGFFAAYVDDSNNRHFAVRDTRYTDAATFKAAMSGVMLGYEAATPTTSNETPQPVETQYGYNVLEPVSGGVQSAEVDTIFYENIAGYIDKRLNGG